MKVNWRHTERAPDSARKIATAIPESEFLETRQESETFPARPGGEHRETRRSAQPAWQQRSLARTIEDGSTYARNSPNGAWVRFSDETRTQPLTSVECRSESSEGAAPERSRRAVCDKWAVTVAEPVSLTLRRSTCAEPTHGLCFWPSGSFCSPSAPGGNTRVGGTNPIASAMNRGIRSLWPPVA